jgi:gliding motility-associated-like protein
MTNTGLGLALNMQDVFLLYSSRPLMFKPLVLMLLLASFMYASADTFTVVSKADSGPGTLREAIDLSNSNGSATHDFIVFNLPGTSEADRRITLLSQLPPLTSNTTIDGTTQPGAPFGISNARITLYLDHYSYHFKFLHIVNAQNVNVFGLHFNVVPDTYAVLTTLGVICENSSQITVGAAGKGNLFSVMACSVGDSYEETTSQFARQIVIQGNVIGISPPATYPAGSSISFRAAEEITIGGATKTDGNIFAGASVYLLQSTNANAPYFMRLQNNRFNVDWNGTPGLGDGGGINVQGNSLDVSLTEKTSIVDNHMIRGSGVSFTNFSHRVEFRGNILGFDATGTTCVGGFGNVSFFNCKDAVVGGYSLQDQNVMLEGIYSNESRVHVMQNKLAHISIFPQPPGTPAIVIKKYNDGLIEGVAPPNSKIQMYEEGCGYNCLISKYHATVFADNNGYWSFPFTADMQNLVATATNSDSITSEFSHPKLDISGVDIVHPTCGRSNGSVSGLRIVEGTHFKWVSSSTLATVGVDTNLKNMGPGDFILLATNGEKGCPATLDATFYDRSPPDQLEVDVYNTTCGKFNGRLATMPRDYIRFTWLNKTQESIGNERFIGDLPPGTYWLKASVEFDASCSKVYGPFTIENVSGPAIVTENMVIKGTRCSRPNGSITGVSVAGASGSIFFEWIDVNGNLVSSSYDLLDVGAGLYRFRFKDNSSCDTVVSTWYEVPQAIAFDEIAVTGSIVKNGSCGANTGSIDITAFSKNADGYQFEWTEAGGTQPVGIGTQIDNLKQGNYRLVATDPNLCEKEIYSAEIKVYPRPVINVNDVSVSNDKCNLGTGKIAGAVVTIDASPGSIVWLNQANQVVASSTVLDAVHEGQYRLRVTDAQQCVVESSAYIVNNIDEALVAPLYEDLTVPRYSSVNLDVKNAGVGEYRLYRDASATVLIAANSTGKFIINSVPTDTMFYVQHVTGSCKSNIVDVAVKVVDRSFFAIPNAFTPNGDGRNDRVPVSIVGYIELHYFRIYNRWGQPVFETKRLNSFWDGVQKGVLQPSGTYVWVAEGKDINGRIVRDKGTITLIR